MRAAVIGHPVGHSLSPVMHRAAYAALGLDWTYEADDVEVGSLEEYLRAVPDDLRGLSVTAPLKRRLVELATTVGEDATTLGVGNTWLPGGRVENTDVLGAIHALGERGVASLASIRILGGGATAASMLLVARRMGAGRAQIIARNPQTAQATAATGRRLGLDVEVTTRAGSDVVDLVVCTVPSHAVDAEQVIAGARAAFDVVYDPWPSALLNAAEAAAKVAVTGVDLLAHQAAEQVRLMTGRTVDVGILRRAALTALPTGGGSAT
jgi:shikimate dehydrogenase